MKRITVDVLNKKAKKADIWCLGCGKRLHEMLELYQKEYFVGKIKGLFDNNSMLWGIEKSIVGKLLLIDNPKKIEGKKGILLITSDHYTEIYNSIKHLINEKNIECYIYPYFYYNITTVLMQIVGKLPVKRQILFLAGNEPHENADEIARYIYEDYDGKKYSIVYLEEQEVEKHNYNIQSLNKWTPRIRTSLRDVVRYCFLYGRSQYLMYENEPLEKISSKQKLFFLNHGILPLKNVSDALKQPEYLDYAVCPGKGCSKIYMEQYGVPMSKQIYMMQPRVDKILAARGKYDVFFDREDSQVILWLPTFRQLAGSERVDSARADSLEIIRDNIYEVDDWLKQNRQKLMIKKHPREKAELKIPTDIENIVELKEQDLYSHKIVVQDLLADTDALITDYSSIAFEYMFLDRPIGYITYDFNDYHRGFSVPDPTAYMPGDRINNLVELKCFLDSVYSGNDRFSEKRRKLIKRLFGDTVYPKGAESLVKFLDGARDGK